jgi:hypothetical protein
VPKEKDAHIVEIMHSVIDALRAHPRVGEDVPIIVAIEACACDGTFIGPATLRTRTGEARAGVLVMTEFSDLGKFGVPKTPLTLAATITTMHVVLSRNMLVIPTDIALVSTRYTRIPLTDARLRSTLSIQFSNFRLDEQTGKIHGKASGANDDRLIAIYWMTKFLCSNNETYMTFRSQYPQSMWNDGFAFAIAGI